MRLLLRPAVILFAIAIIAVVVAGAFFASQNVGLTVKVINPNLSVSITTLPFGQVTDNSVTPLSSFTITNTGDVSLTLAYTISGGNWPPWAIVHLASGNYYNQGGTDLAGVVLAASATLTVYPSLQITQGTGVGGEYSGTLTIGGS